MAKYSSLLADAYDGQLLLLCDTNLYAERVVGGGVFVCTTRCDTFHFGSCQGEWSEVVRAQHVQIVT